MAEIDAVFYVYQHRKADNGEVFYIGKGKGKRLLSERRSELAPVVRTS